MKLLNEIIEECIQADAIFTVYDIIPEAISRGCILSHEKIAEYVKSYRYPIYYTRSIRELVCEIIVPVYHPADKEASDYDASDLLPSTPVIKPKISKKEIITKANILTGDVRTIDKLGRLRLLSSDIKSAGFSNGDIVNRIIDNVNNTIILSKHAPTDKKIKFSKVKVSICTRIAPGIFKMVNTLQPTGVNVKSVNGEIKIIPSY